VYCSYVNKDTSLTPTGCLVVEADTVEVEVHIVNNWGWLGLGLPFCSWPYADLGTLMRPCPDAVVP
jgi:hypothetical protein